MIVNKDVIFSRNNPLVKWVVSLHDKKGRVQSRSFIAEGVKLSFEAIEARLPITHVFVAQSKVDAYLSKISEAMNNELFEKKRAHHSGR